MKTAPIAVALINSCGDDLSVVNAARVSFHKESEWSDEPVLSKETDEHGHWFEYNLKPADQKLIKYLATHKHFSPFNHAFLSFRVKAPIYVARQLVKHKFLPWNEVSRRYVDEEPEFYFTEYRERAENKKQGSGKFHPNAYSLDLNTRKYTKWALEYYQFLLSEGVAPEQAREVLPLNTMTEWIWSGTLGTFCDMLRLRLKDDTQAETRQVAEQIYAFVKKQFPVSAEALLAV